MAHSRASSRWVEAVRQLPPRYRAPWKEQFQRMVLNYCRPGSDLLDVGSGRDPTLPADVRSDVRYSGLDISATELAAAPTGSYNEAIVADVEIFIPALVGRFDLIVSWQVLEHVRDMERTLTNLHQYLRPNGVMVLQLSGGRSLFALANRLVPTRVAMIGLERLLGRSARTVFPAYYDRCTETALRRLMRRWASVEIEPLYVGASYLSFWRPAMRLYVAYEDWIIKSNRSDFATHYRIVGRR